MQSLLMYPKELRRRWGRRVAQPAAPRHLWKQSVLPVFLRLSSPLPLLTINHQNTHGRTKGNRKKEVERKFTSWADKTLQTECKLRNWNQKIEHSAIFNRAACGEVCDAVYMSRGKQKFKCGRRIFYDCNNRHFHTMERNWKTLMRKRCRQVLQQQEKKRKKE